MQFASFRTLSFMEGERLVIENAIPSLWTWSSTNILSFAIPLYPRPIFVRADQQAGGGHHSRGHGGHHNPGFMPGEPAEPGCQLYVGNLSWETGWRELKDHFNQIGNVDRAEVAEFPDGKRKGFGLIRFHTASDAQKAIATLHGEELDGRALEVRLDQKA